MFNFLNKNRNTARQKVLIVRIDAIGDYVLFRNYLSEIRQFYKEYDITLLGNLQWKDLAEYFDSEFVDNFIWLDKSRYKEGDKYVRKFDRFIRKQNFNVLISPVYSREAAILEPLVLKVPIKEKIGFWGDLTGITGVDRILCSKNYTRIIYSDVQPKFEFERNKEFFEKLFNKKIDIKAPYFDLKNDTKFEYTKEKYAVIFPGSMLKFKEWNSTFYAEVINFLTKEYDLIFLLMGGPSDKNKSDEIEKLCDSKKIINITGKTTLKELPYVFKNAEFIISGDTCAYHIALAVDTQVFCISNGHAYIRFLPYPEELTNKVFYVFPDEFKKEYDYTSTLNINEIQPEQVIELIKANYKI